MHLEEQHLLHSIYWRSSYKLHVVGWPYIYGCVCPLSFLCVGLSPTYKNQEIRMFNNVKIVLKRWENLKILRLLGKTKMEWFCFEPVLRKPIYRPHREEPFSKKKVIHMTHQDIFLSHWIKYSILGNYQSNDFSIQSWKRAELNNL